MNAREIADKLFQMEWGSNDDIDLGDWDKAKAGKIIQQALDDAWRAGRDSAAELLEYRAAMFTNKFGLEVAFEAWRERVLRDLSALQPPSDEKQG